MTKMMKIKCIGGKCNGNFHYIESYYRQGDVINVPLINEVSVSFDPNKLPELTQEYDIYKLELVGYNRKFWKILLHIDLNMESFMIGVFEGLFGTFI